MGMLVAQTLAPCYTIDSDYARIRLAREWRRTSAASYTGDGPNAPPSIHANERPAREDDKASLT